MKALGRHSISSLLRVGLEVAWYLLIVIGVVIVAGSLTGLAGDPPGARIDLQVPFAIDASAYEIVSQELGISGAVIRDAAGKLVFRSTSGPLVLVWLCLVGLWIGAALIILYQLRKFFDTLVAGSPFVSENARRLRLIGLVIVAVEIFRVLLVFGQSLYLRAHIATIGISLRNDPRPHLGVLFLGLVMLVIAEVFRRGTELHEEQQLTV